MAKHQTNVYSSALKPKVLKSLLIMKKIKAIFRLYRIRKKGFKKIQKSGIETDPFEINEFDHHPVISLKDF